MKVSWYDLWRPKKLIGSFLFLRRTPFSATSNTSSKNAGGKWRTNINTHFQGAPGTCSASPGPTGLIATSTIWGFLGFGLRFDQSLLGWPLLFGLLTRGHGTSLLPRGLGPFWPLWTTSLGCWTFSIATWPFCSLISPPKSKIAKVRNTWIAYHINLIDLKSTNKSKFTVKPGTALLWLVKSLEKDGGSPGFPPKKPFYVVD